MRAQPTRTLVYHCIWGLVVGSAVVGATTIVRYFSDSLLLVLAVVPLVMLAMVFLEHSRSPLSRDSSDAVDQARAEPSSTSR